MLKDILAVSGHSGLFKLIGKNNQSIIVESLETGKRIPVYQTTKVSTLGDIAIFTTETEVPLVDVFEKISKIENKAACSVGKNASNDEVKEYFEDILPNYDKERVYVSDMKKVLAWYTILQAKAMLDFEKEETASETQEQVKPETSTGSVTANAATKKPVAKAKQTVAKAPKMTKTAAPKVTQKSMPRKAQ
ncbi:MAG: DUF5606 domain-containing protein [Bacteroidales bacterium]|jgi:hypothetical protein|nr:DUF5606 domain-containing protein [Bacteroidales bacterium]